MALHLRSLLLLFPSLFPFDALQHVSAHEMPVQLFYPESGFFDVDKLRGLAQAEIAGSPLIRRAASGDRVAAKALHVGFWPFVREFELAIDRRSLPREPLRQKFEHVTGENKRQVKSIFTGLAREVQQMRQEEGSHAEHWRKDAHECGIPELEAPLIPGVKQLIDSAYVPDLPTFFAVLAGTEFIAEELSAYLVRSSAFTDLFARRRWVWGEVHLIPHDDGPSHLAIDLDLARAYTVSDDAARESIEAAVKATIAQFGFAARDVATAFQVS